MDQEPLHLFFFLGVLLVPKLCHVLYPLFLYLSTWHCGCVCSSDVRELTVSRWGSFSLMQVIDLHYSAIWNLAVSSLHVAIQLLVSHSLLLQGWCSAVTCSAVLLRHTLVPKVSPKVWFLFGILSCTVPSTTCSYDSSLCSIFGFYLFILTPFQDTETWRFEPRQHNFSGGRLWSLALAGVSGRPCGSSVVG